MSIPVAMPFPASMPKGKRKRAQLLVIRRAKLVVLLEAQQVKVASIENSMQGMPAMMMGDTSWRATSLAEALQMRDRVERAIKAMDLELAALGSLAETLSATP